MSTSADPGAANLPPTKLPRKPVATLQVPVGQTWWYNSHRMARHPLAFSEVPGRLSAPGLPRKVLYLATDPITAFWECGLGRDLRDRYLDDRTIRSGKLDLRNEYCLTLDIFTHLRLFDSRNAAARRNIGAKTSACFQGEYAVTQRWAELLMQPWAQLDGLIYESTRQEPGFCLALFDSPASRALIPDPRPAPLRTALNDPDLIVALLKEAAQIS